jgi:pilus assembly protein CpaE
MKRNIVLVGASPSSAQPIINALSDVGEVKVHERVEEAIGALDRASPATVAMITADGQPNRAFEAVGLLREKGLKTLILGDKKDPDLILRALRAGATEFVTAGDSEELRRVVRSLLENDGKKGLGRIVTIFPTKGGVGATALATNLAGALARLDERVCLVDLDLHFGDVLSFLDLQGKYSVSDLVDNMHRLDRDLLDASITRHASGVFVLAQSEKLEEAERIKPSDVTALLAFLRRHYDAVIVDGLRGFDDYSLAVLDAAQLVLLTFTQDVPAVRNAQRCLEILRKINFPEDRIWMLLNRYAKNSKVTPEVVAEVTGLPPSALVRNDFVSLIRAVNRGVMLFDEAPSSKLAQDLELLASNIAGKNNAPVRRGMLASLFS